MSSHIVILEDEPAVLEMLSTALESEGFAVTPVSFPHFDVSMWPHHVDLFLLDLMLPERSGAETAAWLDSHGFGQVPKVCMSASSHVLREATASPYFQAVLPKPFDLSELVDTIRKLLAHPARQLPA